MVDMWVYPCKSLPTFCTFKSLPNKKLESESKRNMRATKAFESRVLGRACPDGSRKTSGPPPLPTPTPTGPGQPGPPAQRRPQPGAAAARSPGLSPFSEHTPSPGFQNSDCAVVSSSLTRANSYSGAASLTLPHLWPSPPSSPRPVPSVPGPTSPVALL